MLPQPVRDRVGDVMSSILKSDANAAEWEQRLSDLCSIEEQLPPNPLERFFDNHKVGRGIWKWRHYFEIYHRHFSRFVGKEVHILEIGIYSGGSLEMWKHYFGPQAKIYGVDIEPACKMYEGDQVQVFIGDQADPDFWKRFREAVPCLDLVVDDGGHEPNQQITTLEEVFPHLRPGGVFLCEDVTCRGNRFASYVARLADQLNAYAWHASDDEERRLSVEPTNLQGALNSIHLYPFVAVLERNSCQARLVAPKHGTEWQPFLK